MSARRFAYFGVAAVCLAVIACGGDDTRDGGTPLTPEADATAQPSPDAADPLSPDATPEPDIELPPDDTLRVVGVDPGVGAAKGGDVVTITGNGFEQDQMQVFFGSSLGFDVFVIDSTRLTVTTPPGNPGLVTVTVSKPNVGEVARLEFGFRYQADVLITGVDPADGDVSGGEPVTISGSGFSQGATTVLFGGKKGIGVQVVDDATIHVTTPAAAVAGLVTVHVSNDQGAAGLKGGFTYTEAPVLTFVAPGAGPASGGTEVTLSGRGFTPTAVVRFGEAEAAKLTFVDAATLLAVTPPGAPGVVPVTVQTEHGYGGLPSGFTYMDQEPTEGVLVVSVTPAKGSTDGGDTAYVTAYGLTDLADTVVTFDGAEAEVLAVDAAKLQAVVVTPPGAVGPADVAVTTAEGSDSLAGGFTYANVLKVASVSPGSGPVEGGTAITVSGQGFLEGAAVRVGALPCSGVQVLGATSLTCVTPPGSPGAAAVSVSIGPEKATLADGFFYESGTMELFVVDPVAGSQAGGTWIRLLGAGFEAPVDVLVDGNPATHIKVESSTLITAKTPPGEVGTVDIALQGAAGSAILPQAFTYYDPVALFGGTWGPEVEGAVNVTVLDAGNGQPIADAFVMLQVDPDTPYQGFSNAVGQITFSGPDVLGTQMVSASKEGYESNSVIKFDATNITIYLTPLPTPAAGGPPPSASISGKVFGLGKYVVVPPGDCAAVGVQGNGACTPCETSADCTGVASTCSTIGITGTFCTAACGSDADCMSGFSCLSVGAGGAQCVPSPGKKQARCYTSMGSIFGQLPQSETPLIVKDDGTYQIGSRLGELAVICLGGYVAWNNPDDNSNFTPLAYGVKRHINVAPGANPGHDVTLNHPLTRTIKIRLDSPPYDPQIGPEYLAALVYWDFGSDGGFMHRSFQGLEWGGANDQIIEVPHQPVSFTGDVYDAAFQILGVALSFDVETNSQLPASYTLLSNLKQIETDQVFRLDGGHWDAVKGGVTRTINALWGFGDTNVWGVGDNGAIVHFNGGGWNQQASPTTQPLYGIWGPAADDMWAVGADGTALRFDGAVWTPQTITTGTQDLRGIWGSGPDDIWVAAGSWAGIWHYDGQAWTKTAAAGADLRDIHGHGDTVVAVGTYGSIRRWDGATWTSQFIGSSANLLSVHVVSATEAYAVGTGGTIVHWDGTQWTEADSPTNRSLRAVWAAGPLDVYAVGDGSTLLHYDGNAWAEQTIASKVSYNALQALWGNPQTSKGFALGTSEVLMGPMLQIPQDQVPEDNGQMQGYHIGFGVKEGVPAHFNFISVAIPGLFGDTPVWSITTAGDVFEFDLPDFANIEGTPGIPAGAYKLTIMRVYKDNFDIDNYDLSDFSTAAWRSWAIDVTFFTK